MRYSYDCSCGRETEVEHGMFERPQVVCVCGKYMKRLPPKRVIGTRNAGQTLLENMDDKYRKWRTRAGKRQ